MKRRLLTGLAATALIASMTAATVQATDAINTGDVPIGSSNEVQMVGMIEPTIMSVTMPTYVPFYISRTVEGDNKVVSPRITITNRSSVPVSLDVVYTNVDLSKLEGTTWSNGQYVGANQIAIGFQNETVADQAPTSLNGTSWLQQNASNIHLMSLGAYGNSSMYVVGTLGNSVPENNTFSVTPTIVVSQAQ